MLTIAGKTFSKEDLSAFTNFSIFNEYDQSALLFCKNWLSRQKTFLMHTSGSTGTPKPILLQRKHMLASIQMTRKAFALQAGQTSLVCLNVQYIAGMMMLARGLEIGLEMTVIAPDRLPLAHFSETTAFDFLSFVPLQIQETLEKTPEKIPILNQAKSIIIGGAVVSTALEEKLQTIQTPVFHTYGMTETVSHIALRRLNGLAKSDSFTVLEGVSIELDERNCLVIASPTAEGRIITNDVIELSDKGTFRWLGRFDNVINSGGVKVHAEKVEQALENFFQTMGLENRFFIIGLPDEIMGQHVALVIETTLRFEIEKIREYGLGAGLSKYELPKELAYSEKFAETATGKVDKKESLNKLKR
ncbi:MAG: AMP-binding protein [Verrucomicrobia bacterium]|nr:AMP-binding protein [Cytophagales bacterium]